MTAEQIYIPIRKADSILSNRVFVFVRRNPTLTIGGGIFAVILAGSLLAPLAPGDAFDMQPILRMRPPSAESLLGTDQFGRDVLARSLYGGQVSLIVGCSVTALALIVGIFLGVIAGYFRAAEAPLMRLMDALMSIPAVLLAIALVALTKPGVATVVLAIAIPEIPRVVRLVRSVVLSMRSAVFVEAAIVSGSNPAKIIRRHILPSTIGPLMVQATYICASAILIEATLSFLGAGAPPEIPTWGNMIAASRLYLANAPWTIFVPSVFLALTVLSVNLIGDGLRDRLDPRLARRL
ncbi:ABC transporter permease [Roseibium aggregatum]|uniref:ABC transporter permease n=1 Tax=Roseibium aggregatum TaxID=187304 RepID=UPI003A97EE98